MAALGDHDGLHAALADDARAASTTTGPFDWEPLLYLAYSRVELDAPRFDPLVAARVLLDAGADPNAGYLWDGNLPPFTALTGVLGCGERGEPPHAQALALARLLLERGADPNDGQTIYNHGLGNMRLADDVDWLELLYEFGFGDPSAGSWYRRFGGQLHTPADLVAEVLQHSAQTGLVERARLVLAHGADPNRRWLHPAFGDVTPYEAAVEHGNGEIATMLAAAGADTSGVDDLQRFVGALLAGDALVRMADAALVDAVRRAQPDLVRRAADLRKLAAIEPLVALGFDVNAGGGRTALHEAALHGDRAMVDVLLRVGADPTVRDAEFDGTPAGWAVLAGFDDLAALLERAATDGAGLT